MVERRVYRAGRRSSGDKLANSYIEGQLADKRAHANTEWEDRHDDLRGAIANTRQKLWLIPQPDAKASDEEKQAYAAAHAQGLQELTGAIQAYQDFLHPEKNPGMFDRIKHRIGLNEHPLSQVAPARISPSQPGVAASSVDLGPQEAAPAPATAPVTVKGPNGQSITTKPQDTPIAAPVASGVVATPALPATKTPSAAPAPPPGQYSTGTVKQLKERAEALRKAQTAAGQMAAGAPILPEDEAARQMHGKMAQIDRSNLSPEDKEEAKRHLYGLNTKPENKLFKMSDGTLRYVDVNAGIPDGATAYVKPDAFSQKMTDYNADPRTPAEKGSLEHWLSMETLKPSSGLEASLIRALYGDHPTADQYKKGIAEYKEINSPVKTSEADQIIYDADGHAHIFHKVSTSRSAFPGAGGGGTSPPPASASSATAPPDPSPGGGAKPNPTALRKEAESRKPSAPSTPKAAKSPIGDAIPGFSKATPAVTAASKDVIAAKKVDGLAQQAAKSKNPVEQRQLALAMIKAMAGRVNMQEFQQYTTKMGVENTIDGMIKGIESGQLPEGIMDHLVNAAHANYKASQESLQLALSGTAGMSGDVPQPQSYKATATGPNGHKIGTNDDPNSPTAKWFDAQTGKPL